MQIKQRDAETGEIQQAFTPLAGSTPTPKEQIIALQTENTNLKSRLADVELALADLFTT
ncbi:hypothetical protein [Paenibacillus cymbidii]|uniref:hypothetical protein n=1 Tax=Paenibacillus cymbidii TaxID=1639034 RepID=UPI0014368ACF|nr:hypothetical protein [Paenibacillus cymbidii]